MSLALAVVLVAILPSVTVADELTITMLGHAAVHLSDGKRAIVVDFPYDAGADFTSWDTAHWPPGPKPMCLVTHGHRDHFAPEASGTHCAAVAGPKDAL